MGRFLLNGLPISLIYRHLKAKSGALCCSSIPFTPHILHRTSPESLLARGIPRPASRLTFSEFSFNSRDFTCFMMEAMAESVTGIPLMHYWCANASSYAASPEPPTASTNRLRATFQQLLGPQNSLHVIVVSFRQKPSVVCTSSLALAPVSLDKQFELSKHKTSGEKKP